MKPDLQTAQLPKPRQRSALKPTELSELAQRAVNDLLREGESPNTLASYRGALRYWGAWFALRYGLRITLPVPVAAVQQFVVDHVQRKSGSALLHELPPGIDSALVDGGFKGKSGPLALATVQHRLAVLSKAHQLRDLRSPMQDPQVRELLTKTRRAYARRGVRPDKKAALTKAPLAALLATCDDSIIGKRDRALLLFAWSTGGRRRSEVSAADMRFLRPLDGEGFVYELHHSKTNQAGAELAENYKPVLGEAASALRIWLAAAGIASGRIFRRVSKGGVVGEALSDSAVRSIVKRRCELAGISGNFSAHSLRSGFASEAISSGATAIETMFLTGHKDIRSLAGYFRSTAGMSPVLQAMVSQPSGAFKNRETDSPKQSMAMQRERPASARSQPAGELAGGANQEDRSHG